MKKLFIQSLRLTVVFTVLTGLVYPLVITGLAQILFSHQANGSLIRRQNQMVGSEWLAQRFENPRYFQTRPSAGDFVTVPSGASNLGPTSSALQSNVVARITTFRAENKLSPNAWIPSDMIFASASGLDPHISPNAARLQVNRVTEARGLNPTRVAALVEQFIEPPQFGILGETRMNVLRLNLALDELH